jgi:hypothetical protein
MPLGAQGGHLRPVQKEDAVLALVGDARIAGQLARLKDMELEVWPIPDRLGIDAAMAPLFAAYRQATAGYRGSGAPWLVPLMRRNPQHDRGRFIRGSGGEILRGFYQGGSTRIDRIGPAQLAHCYDVSAGSQMVRGAFARFIETTGFTEERLMGWDPNDLFYWEHRMGTWGSLALSEADLAARSLPGFNARNLFASFMALDWPLRAARRGITEAIAELDPDLARMPLA